MGSAKDRKKESVEQVITGFTHRMRSIAECAEEHIAHAAQNHAVRMKAFSEKIEILAQAAPPTSDGRSVVSIRYQDHKWYHDGFGAVVAPHTRVLAHSLLIYAFSTFDAFVGSLIRALYRAEPILIKTIEEKDIKISELLESGSVDACLDRVVERDISTLLRDSYDDLFKRLATRHGIATLSKFDNYPEFIECSQRRNLITHCDGVVSDQYIKKCNSAGVKIPASITVGIRLNVSADYLANAIDLLHQVGFMLGIVLWRKSVTGCGDTPEKMVTGETYDLLVREKWKLAERIGLFGVNLPHPISDIYSKFIRVNYAQALKWSGRSDAADRVLKEVDWTACVRDLRLAVAVLHGDFVAASKLMRDIGRAGEHINQDAYLEWPVFRDFRRSVEFTRAYSEIYGEMAPEASVNEFPDFDTAGVSITDGQINVTTPAHTQTHMPQNEETANPEQLST